MIDVKFVLYRTESFGSRKIIPPPVGSDIEVRLNCLPNLGDTLHIHKSLLPAYYLAGGNSPGDYKIDLGEDSGDYKDTVKIRVLALANPSSSFVHIIRPDCQKTLIMFSIDVYEKHGWQDMKA